MTTYVDQGPNPSATITELRRIAVSQSLDPATITVTFRTGNLQFAAPDPVAAAFDPDVALAHAALLAQYDSIGELALAQTSAAIPAVATGATTETMTDPISGNSMTVIVVPEDCAVLAVKIAGDAHPRLVLNADGGDYESIALGNGVVDPVTDGVNIGLAGNTGNPTDLDLNISVPAGRRVSIGGKLNVSGDMFSSAKIISNGIGVGNHLEATTPGTVVQKVEIFDITGGSLGFIPVYDTIT